MPTSNRSPTLITTVNGKHHVTVNSFLTMKKRKRFQPMTCIANANKKESNKEQFTFSINYLIRDINSPIYFHQFMNISLTKCGVIDILMLKSWTRVYVDRCFGHGCFFNLISYLIEIYIIKILFQINPADVRQIFDSQIIVRQLKVASFCSARCSDTSDRGRFVWCKRFRCLTLFSSKVIARIFSKIYLLGIFPCKNTAIDGLRINCYLTFDETYFTIPSSYLKWKQLVLETTNR